MTYLNTYRNHLKSKRELKVSSRLYSKYKEFTMIPFDHFHTNIKLLSEVINVTGSVVECGVWRGGMIASMAEVLGNTRRYLLFDSFEGLPRPKPIDGKAALEWQNNKEGAFYFDNCKAEIEFAQLAMRMADVKTADFIKGWFAETIPNYKEIEQIAVLRLDCDWYDSVMTCLEKFFPHVSNGGLILIDDYFTWDGCALAVHDYLSKNKLPYRIQTLDGQLAYIKK
jgi:O-methyltransferase